MYARICRKAKRSWTSKYTRCILSVARGTREAPMTALLLACATGSFEVANPTRPDADIAFRDSDTVVQDDTGAGHPPDDASAPDWEPTTDIYQHCFSDFMSPEYPLPDYDRSGARIGSHCLGTDHQAIPDDIEQVVFIGDSVTLGSPPADSSQWYRNVLMHRLADRYGLQKAGWTWQNVDIISGKPLQRFDGDFGVCAWWGARTDDLVLSNQLPDCLPESSRGKSTLVIITSGGNDVFKQVQAKAEGTDDEQITAAYDEWVLLMREGLEWLKEPGRFSNGVYVIFANVYEYSDGTGDLGSCPGADWFGFGAIDTTHIDALTRRAMDDYLQMAVDTETDMLLMREGFCGHGFNAGDPSAPCYRGTNAPVWFDETCIHPNARGHSGIADMVMSVIEE